jgi:hypothetical protein
MQDARGVHAAQAIQDLAEVQPDLRLVKAAACLSHAPDQALQVSCKRSKQHYCGTTHVAG